MEPVCRMKEIYKALYRFGRGFPARYGITVNGTVPLCCLGGGKACTAGEMCGYVGLSGSRVSRVITSVEETGCVRRGTGLHDRRPMLFALAREGVAPLGGMRQDGTVFFDAFFGELMRSLGGEPDVSTNH